MRRPSTILGAAVLFLTAGAVPAFTQQDAASRGKYIFDAAGCYACHTQANGAPIAGGGALRTPFGIFYAPNITPDAEFGIGKWTEADFIRALREGVSPRGDDYYPVFPYTSYTKMSERDIRDLFAYLKTTVPAKTARRSHELSFPYSIRTALIPWRWLNFTAGEWKPDPGRHAVINRGAYLVQAIAHCGECHTPRGSLGGPDRANDLSGARMPVGDLVASNLTPDKSGLDDWSEADIVDLLETGSLPQGGTVGGEMAEVVKHATSRLTLEDRRAIAVYLKSLPPRPTLVKRKAG